jgi:MFS family permease
MTAGTGRYRALFAQPGSRSVAVAGLVGRLPNGMIGIGFLLAVVQVGDSYLAAGAAIATYTTAAAVFGPIWTRTADRVGARRVLLIVGPAQSLTLAAVAVCVGVVDQAGPLIALAVPSGALLPPLAAIMRSMWSRTVPDEDVRAAAAAFESMVVEVVWVAGPCVVAVAAAVHPALAFAVAAAATLIGCGLVAVNSRMQLWSPLPRAERSSRLGPLRHGPVLGVLPVGLLLLGSIGAIEVSVVSFADHAGQPEVAGLLIAALSVGGILGGLAWGSRRQPGTTTGQALVLIAVTGAAWAALVLAEDVGVLVVLLVVAGLALTPAITAIYGVMDEVAPQEQLTESFGWLSSVGAAGSSIGSAAAGAVAGAVAGNGFLLAAAMCATAAGIALVCRPTWRRAALDRRSATGFPPEADARGDPSA